MDNKTNKMLIDATHPEETRVVVLRAGRVEEFDYESAARKLLRGSIYLAKVTRVEPSLQAAFVEYGGNRHGFLAFNEIHPDYYQIPMSDRQALIDEEAAAEAEADAEADARAERRAQGGQRRRDGGRDGDSRNGNRHRHGGQQLSPDETVQPGDEQPHVDTDAAANDGSTRAEGTGHDHPHLSEAYTGDQARVADTGSDRATTDAAHGTSRQETNDDRHQDRTEHGHSVEATPHTAADHLAMPAGDHDRPTHTHHDGGHHGVDHIEEVVDVAEAPETIGAGADDDAGMEDDGADEPRDRPRRQRRRQYKIQEVIKRRQVILVQVVKEERGNKGAALTTYLSLAGRYTVLMPNTGRGGGISRKITQPGDRKRLKAIAQELDVQEGMGLIIRTAGAARTSQEIKRDYEYLLRLWESVRELTLQSTAPSLVYEEGNLIKRSIRDLYTKEIDEVVVAGDQAYEDAHAFMRMLMPSHTKNVTRYTQPEAIFSRYPIERQLTAMFSPYVTLKSGGYIVINQTEALVSIDVNSGKSTREYSIEDTALATNLEASDEIARQLKLRDLAGLIVIDFIDMEEKRNNRKVEHRLTDALRFDRARIQVGRISHFGLMEMSRQRMRTGVLEGSTSQCPHCQGTGMIRSTESVALAVLRGLEDHLAKDARSSVNVLSTSTVALYILNNKRSFILDIERRYGVAVAVQASDRMQGANFAIERSAVPLLPARAPDRAAVSMDWGLDGEETHDEAQETPDAGDRAINEIEHVGDDEERDGQSGSQEGSQDGQRDGRGRRRRRRGRDRDRGDRGAPPVPAEANRQSGSTPDGDTHGGNVNTAPRDNADLGTHADDEAFNDVGSEPDGERTEGDGDRGPRRGRRRGRRGGRRGREGGGAHAETGGGEVDTADADSNGDKQDGNGDEPRVALAHVGRDQGHPAVAETHATNDAPSHSGQGDQSHAHAEPQTEPSPAPSPAVPVTAPIVAIERIAAAAATPEAAAELVSPADTMVPEVQLAAAADDPSRPRRRGWWQRRGLGE